MRDRGEHLGRDGIPGRDRPTAWSREESHRARYPGVRHANAAGTRDSSGRLAARLEPVWPPCRIQPEAPLRRHTGAAGDGAGTRDEAAARVRCPEAPGEPAPLRLTMAPDQASGRLRERGGPHGLEAALDRVGPVHGRDRTRRRRQPASAPTGRRRRPRDRARAGSGSADRCAVTAKRRPPPPGRGTPPSARSLRAHPRGVELAITSVETASLPLDGVVAMAGGNRADRSCHRRPGRDRPKAAPRPAREDAGPSSLPC